MYAALHCEQVLRLEGAPWTGQVGGLETRWVMSHSIKIDMGVIYQHGYYLSNMSVSAPLRRTGVAVTGAQLRAARGLLNMSVSELAERTGLAMNTIRRAEATNGQSPITAANGQLLLATLEAAGVIFIAADDFGAGVRLRDPGVTPLQPRRREVD